MKAAALTTIIVFASTLASAEECKVYSDCTISKPSVVCEGYSTSLNLRHNLGSKINHLVSTALVKVAVRDYGCLILNVGDVVHIDGSKLEPLQVYVTVKGSNKEWTIVNNDAFDR